MANRCIPPLALLLIVLCPLCVRAEGTASPNSFFVPRPHQFDLEVADNSLIDDGSSLVRRRQDSINGSALHLADDLGVDTLQMPSLHLDFWLDDTNALEFQFRYLALYGSEPLGTAVFFNGDLILPNQSQNTSGTTWFTGTFDLIVAIVMVCQCRRGTAAAFR